MPKFSDARPKIYQPVRRKFTGMHAQMYHLPQAWETAISEWCGWLVVAGMSRLSIRTRRGHVRAAARLLAMQTPADVTTNNLVKLAEMQDWSNATVGACGLP